MSGRPRELGVGLASLLGCSIPGDVTTATGADGTADEGDGSSDTTSGATPATSTSTTSQSPSEEDGSESESDPSDPLPEGTRTVLVHLFEWRWSDVAEECETVLGPHGFEGVQVSPPQEYALIDGSPWWERYQPVSYDLVGRSGDAAAFVDMVQRCAAVGVEIYVDAVLNHMAFGSGQPGSGGTTFDKYDYPGLYSALDFHDCRREIADWDSRWEIQFCELSTLPDLATERPEVRARLSEYLQGLLDVGVAGFRVDAAKHVPADDLEAILGPLAPPPIVYQEVIFFGDHEAVHANEYSALGEVTEFRYGLELSRVLREGQLAWLESFGSDWGMLPTEDALVFVDNHDNQRGHGAGNPITHTQPDLYRIAVAFMLAWPYGHPQLMSSYAFTDGFHGPPRNARGETLPSRTAAGDCAPGWVCEHRWPSTLGMVGFRNATQGEPVERWWTDGNDRIAFARGDRGFFVLNGDETPMLEQRLQTGLPPGRYCDVISGDATPEGLGCTGLEVAVDERGAASFAVGPLGAVAIHVDRPSQRLVGDRTVERARPSPPPARPPSIIDEPPAPPDVPAATSG